MKCTVPDIHTRHRSSERLGKGYTVPGAMKAWTWAGLVPWLIESWVLPLGFPTNCVQTPSCWVLPTATQSSAEELGVNPGWGWVLCLQPHARKEGVWCEATFSSTGIWAPKSWGALLPSFLIRQVWCSVGKLFSKITVKLFTFLLQSSKEAII